MLERDKICLEKDSVESNMKPRFLARQAGNYGLSGREGERERVDYFRGLLRETDEKEFSFRGIESKIIQTCNDMRHEMRVIVD